MTSKNVRCMETVFPYKGTQEPRTCRQVARYYSEITKKYYCQDHRYREKCERLPVYKLEAASVELYRK